MKDEGKDGALLLAEVLHDLRSRIEALEHSVKMIQESLFRQSVIGSRSYTGDL